MSCHALLAAAGPNLTLGGACSASSAALRDFVKDVTLLLRSRVSVEVGKDDLQEPREVRLLLPRLGEDLIELHLSDTTLVVNEPEPEKLQHTLAGHDIVDIAEPVDGACGLKDETPRSLGMLHHSGRHRVEERLPLGT